MRFIPYNSDCLYLSGPGGDFFVVISFSIDDLLNFITSKSDAQLIESEDIKFHHLLIHPVRISVDIFYKLVSVMIKIVKSLQ